MRSTQVLHQTCALWVLHQLPSSACRHPCTAQYVVDFLRESMASIFDQSNVTYFEVRKANSLRVWSDLLQLPGTALPCCQYSMRLTQPCRCGSSPRRRHWPR